MHACMASSTIFALFSILLFFSPPAASDAAANALLLFKEQLRNTSALRSWGRGGRPCPGGSGRSWAGVVCLGSSVLGLHLEGMGLTAGAIDVKLLAGLSDLSAINFASKHLAGPMPAVSCLPATNSPARFHTKLLPAWPRLRSSICPPTSSPAPYQSRWEWRRPTSRSCTLRTTDSLVGCRSSINWSSKLPTFPTIDWKAQSRCPSSSSTFHLSRVKIFFFSS